MGSEYTSKQLSALGDLEAIRLRKGMYVGDADNPAHLFQEAFDNALDESIGGYSKLTRIDVDSKTHTYQITDYGRGIPLGTMEVDLMGTIFRKSTLEVLTSKTHSGGKFGNGGYKLSSGLHGVGLCCLAALSDSFEVKVFRISDDTGLMTEGTIHYRNGVLQSQSYDTNLALKVTGTSIKFRADKDIFPNLEIPRSYIINKCKIASAFKHKVELYIDGVQEDVSSRGLEDLLDLEEAHPLHDPINLSIKDPDSGEFMEVCIIYTSDIKSSTKGFTNLLYNSAGGTHTRLLDRAIKEAWSELLPKDNILKEWDILLGMRAVTAVFIQETSFSSQTKEKLNVPNGNLKVLMDMFKLEFIKYMKKNSKLSETLITKFNAYREAQNRLLASKEVQGLVQVADVKDGRVRRKSVVPGLSECSTKDVEKTELFICEGESAKGSLMSCRDTAIHGILPIRGKIQNTSYLSVKDALQSQEVLNIVNAIGCGVSDDSDHTKSRYGKVIVACFTGDTKIPMLDGTLKSFKELVELEESNPGMTHWVYSMDENGKVVPGEGRSPRITNTVDELVDIELENGETISCTPDHRFRLIDGSYKRADELTELDDIADISISFSGDDEVFQTNSGDSDKTHWRMYSEGRAKFEVIHHEDNNHYNNEPTNLRKFSSKSEHSRHHAKLQIQDGTNGLLKYNTSQDRLDKLSKRQSGIYQELGPNAPFVLQLVNFNKSEKHRQQVRKMNSDDRMKVLQRCGKLRIIRNALFEENLDVDRECLSKLSEKYKLPLTESSITDEDMEFMKKLQRSEGLPVLKSGYNNNPRGTKVSMVKVICDYCMKEYGYLNEEVYQQHRKDFYKKSPSWSFMLDKYFNNNVINLMEEFGYEN